MLILTPASPNKTSLAHVNLRAHDQHILTFRSLSSQDLIVIIWTPPLECWRGCHYQQGVGRDPRSNRQQTQLWLGGVICSIPSIHQTTSKDTVNDVFWLGIFAVYECLLLSLSITAIPFTPTITLGPLNNSKKPGNEHMYAHLTLHE